MDLVITSEDFRRLSSATQKELLALLMNGESERDATPELGDLEIFEPQGATLNASFGSGTPTGKLVFSINAEQSDELLSNLAEKSQQTLRLFAIGERVAIDDLIGDSRPYKDMNELKRSFVGAVNRRLRTVVGNRSAVLFSSDRDRQRIRVLPGSAAALRNAMGIPEPEVEDAFDSSDYEDELDEETKT
ncbi:MAG: hypothetical protein KJ787_04070 [Gammaproteobacteria bacterium]|nr:hypothetical protein [Gammaproteobacteria bacterium]MBU1645487.1 hypothetical protein [Gammaproteobacteria bacterium]MBU1971110.1 hypothetical protein [Gammaproteobacteria bacterium]